MAIDSSVQLVQYSPPHSVERSSSKVSDAIVDPASLRGENFSVEGGDEDYWANRQVARNHPTTVMFSEKIFEHKKRNFLRRIPQNEWNAIIQKITRLNHSISLEELTAFRLGNWAHPVFDHADWIYFAFQAYLEDRLDLDTMCKLFLYSACQRQVTIDEIGESDALELLAGKGDCFSVFKSSLGFASFQVVKSDGEFDEPSRSSLRAASREYLDDGEFQVFLNLLSELRPEQTQFFIIQREYDALFDGIREETEWPLFITYSSALGDSQPAVWQTVASPEFIYRMHQARFGENAIRPSPALGYSEIEHLSHPTSRVVSIPSFVPLPKKLLKT